MKIFKIRNKDTGLFFKGGTYFPSVDSTSSHYYWDAHGATWISIGGLRKTLNAIIQKYGTQDSWEIVEFDLVESSAKPMIDYINPQKIVDALSKK